LAHKAPKEGRPTRAPQAMAMSAGTRQRSRPPSSERAQSVSRPPTPSASEAGAANVRVVCRLRPMDEREKKLGTVPAANTCAERREVAVVRKVGGSRQVRSSFYFDEVLSSFSTQEDTFNATLLPLVDQVLAGYEATAFAYGQTGTGKTYTMEGDADSEEGRGLMPRAAAAVLQALSHEAYTERSVTVSYLEIYNEELSDLLAPVNSTQKLELMESGDSRGVCCIGLSEIPVSSLGELLDLVKMAQERKRIAETRINARSSRSHCIFTMKVRCRRRVAAGELDTVGKLHLVDLAGSECAKKAAWAAEDAAAFVKPVVGGTLDQERERRNINQSLLTLGRVISALRESAGRVPYRDSKLTRLLKDALGGSCKTVIIATISPALTAVDETISTLNYAEQAAGIRNRPIASSLLRSSRAPGDGSGTNQSGCSSTEWAELEMKVAYLSAEVEEAQAALARKYQEMQEMAERAEHAEGKLMAAEEELKQTRAQLDESIMLRDQMAEAAKAIAADLKSTAGSITTSSDTLGREVLELREQRVSEERMLSLLKEQRGAMESDISSVYAALDSAKAELVDTRSQVASLKENQANSRERALEAIINFARSELNNVGADLDHNAESVCSHLDSAEALAGEARQSAAAAESQAIDKGAELAGAASAWSKQVAERCDIIENESSKLVKSVNEMASGTADRLHGIQTAAIGRPLELRPRGLETAAGCVVYSDQDCQEARVNEDGYGDAAAHLGESDTWNFRAAKENAENVSAMAPTKRSEVKVRAASPAGRKQRAASPASRKARPPSPASRTTRTALREVN